MLWIVGIVLVLMAALFFYRSVGPNKDKTQPIPTKMRVWMAIFGIVFAYFGYLSISSASASPASSAAQIVYGKSSMGALVRYAVNDAIPTSNLVKNGKALLGYSAENGNIGMSVEADDNFGHSMVVGGIEMNTATIMHDLFRDHRVRNVLIDWYYPETDSYGHQKNISAIEVGWTRSTYNQVDWTNFDSSNIPQVSDVYQVNPEFK